MVVVPADAARTTAAIPANATSARPPPGVRRSPNSSPANTRIRAGCRDGISVAAAIEVLRNDSYDVMKLRPKQMPAGTAAHNSFVSMRPPVACATPTMIGTAITVRHSTIACALASMLFTNSGPHAQPSSATVTARYGNHATGWRTVRCSVIAGPYRDHVP